MIVSASRRTDIPAFYSDWFYNRIKEGFVMVRNPMNVRQITKVPLNREVTDCFVFWTKNPADMMPKLDLINDYPYYFQFTLNPYDRKIETNVPVKNAVVKTFKKLSAKIGPDRVVWRYDPIMLTSSIDIDYHEKHFTDLAEKLNGYTKRCVISFVDSYKKSEKNFKSMGIIEITDDIKKTIAKKISKAAESFGLRVESCAEDMDLSEYGVNNSRCIDPVLIRELLGAKISTVKDRNQRKSCGCISSVDIGAYNTCMYGCRYCYANCSEESVKMNVLHHNTDSSLICGELTKKDVVSVKDFKSCVFNKGG